MKKLITLLLVLTGAVCSANATRVYVKITGVDWSSFYLYIYDESDYRYTGQWDNCALNSLGSNWYYIDTYKSFDSNVKWYIHDSGYNQSPDVTDFTDIKGKYLNVTAWNTMTWEDLEYVAYSPTTQTTLATLSSADGQNYIGVVDNQTSFDDDLDVLLAPKFLLDFGYGVSSVLWTQSFRPWDDYNQHNITYDFHKKALTDVIGIFGGSNNWTLTNPYHYKFTLNIGTDHNGNTTSVEVAPYFTTTIADASGYATFSNDEKCTISGAELYVVNENNDSYVRLSQKDNATVWPEKEGVILKGAQNDEVTISAVAADATASTIGANYLVGIGNAAETVTATDDTYVFASDGAGGVGFYKASGSGELAAHKAYLDLSRSSFKAREFLAFSFDDDVTGCLFLISLDSFHRVKLNCLSTLFNSY